jgi:hypothetical protein
VIIASVFGDWIVVRRVSMRQNYNMVVLTNCTSEAAITELNELCRWARALRRL